VKREPVTSSNLRTVGYDPELRILEIEFQPNRSGAGAVWQYDNISPGAHEELLASESIGRAFSAMLPGLSGRRVATVGPDGVEVPHG
jgi:hypothetical protein